ncbi:Fur family transcriptional regulator [Actinotalea sp. JY-7876]|uniref:Fur family transcriptional regulator n=1 Tax=Actinotalea sp. JY-7876 TaxID=2758442 RepID=UPI0015F66CD9|nr:Fur family transcriptional regulator [Actinotalea sp. JY-7876]
MTSDEATSGHTPDDAATTVARVRAMLRARGERMTRPRRAVLTVLSRADGHLGAEEILGAVAQEDPTVHRATVYRTLEALAALGVVQHVHVRRTGTAYHLAREAHLHAECQRCGVVQDLPAALLDDVARVVDREHGFALAATHVALSGVCRQCRTDPTGPAGPAGHR